MERVTLTEKNFSRLKEFVKRERGKTIIFTSNDDDFNRKVAEKLPVNIITIPLYSRRDYTKQRDSGFNEIIAKIFKKNNIALGFNVSELINSKHKERILARLSQNVKLCARLRVKIKFIYDEKKVDLIDIKSLGSVLGMQTWMTKKL